MQPLPFRYVWAGHLQSEARVAPGGEDAPMGHDLQEFPTLYVSAGHLQSEARVDPAGEV